ncbi:MAG: hypothetical protein CM15mP120_18430 [Pseudomonadota bacterium]|nr:MAG: hypothetical protein CM15mP120_18430 [Pseudomonadota bacterium]
MSEEKKVPNAHCPTPSGSAEFWRGPKGKNFGIKSVPNWGNPWWAPPRSLHGLCAATCNGLSAGPRPDLQLRYCAFKPPPFSGQGPLCRGLCDWMKGQRFLTNVVGVDDPGADVHIGQRVH